MSNPSDQADRRDNAPKCATKRCVKCAYCLDGLADNRCPECGRPFDPHDPRTYIDVSDKRRKVPGVMFLMAVCFCILSLSTLHLPTVLVDEDMSLAVLRLSNSLGPLGFFGLLAAALIGSGVLLTRRFRIDLPFKVGVSLAWTAVVIIIIQLLFSKQIFYDGL
ncbi:MAG: hypothetical protein J5J06_18120 [Phycisphaerae bacterium]|nr:hypothetical protein [Phycisphaerae bacterium]